MKYAMTEDAFRKLICGVKQRIDDHTHNVVDMEDLDTLIASETDLGLVMIGDGINIRDNGTIWTEHTVYEAMTNSEIDSICK